MKYLLVGLYRATRAILKPNNRRTSLAIVLTLALTTGATAAVLAVVSVAVIRPLPYNDASRLRLLWHTYPGLGIEKEKVSPPSFALYETKLNVFTALAAMGPPRSITVGIGMDSDPVAAREVSVTPKLFAMLGVQPVSGRLFYAEDVVTRGRARVALISFALWKTRFGSADLLNKDILINDQPIRVVGVLPEAAQILEHADIWTPLGFSPEQLSPAQHGNEYLLVIGRLGQHASDEDLQRQIASLSSEVRTAYPNAYRAETRWHITAESLRSELTGRYSSIIRLLAGAALVLLVIGCVNVAALFLAKSATSQHESAIKLALGASRNRVIMDVALEVVVLTGAAIALGAAIAAGLLQQLAIRIQQLGNNVPPWNSLALDWTTPALVAIIAIACGFGSSCFLLWRLGSGAIENEMRGASRVLSTRRQARVLHGLSIAEVATSCILLIGSGLLVKTINALNHVDTGFSPRSVMTFRVILPRTRYASQPNIRLFQDTLVQRLESMPNVRRAGFASSLPFQTNNAETLVLTEGQSDGSKLQSLQASYIATGGHYFDAIGIRMISGRTFTEQDGPTTLRVAIVDDAAARRLWPGKAAIGQRIAFGFEKDASGSPQWRQVIGVAHHIKDRALESDADFQFYIPVGQAPPSAYSYVVRGSGPPAGLAPIIQGALSQIDRRVPMHSAAPMSTTIEDSFAFTRIAATLVEFFAALALTLTLAGLYGVLSYLVALRTREIGVRLALGATPRTIIQEVMRSAITLAGAGVLLAIVISFFLSSWIRSIVFGVEPFDPATLVVSAVSVFVVAAVASYVPARSASRLDPALVLRSAV